MKPARILISFALVLGSMLASPLLAHEPAKGRNGGLRVDAGVYHTELLVDGTTKVVIFLSDVEDKPIPSAGFKGTAILIIDGKSQRIEMLPAEASMLVGTAPAPVQPGVKGVVQLFSPDGKTSQGKF